MTVAFPALYACSGNEKTEEAYSRDPRITEIDSTELHSLMLNDSENLRLINIWATWCAPCLEEFPVFVELTEKYRNKKFEFIAVSADEQKDKSKVLRFLNRQEPAVDSYIFETEDVYHLIYSESIGWNGSLPFTILVEPGGKVIYRLNEAIEPNEFKLMLSKHPILN